MSARLERLVQMQDMIQRGRYPNVPQLCEMFEIKERTVYEDIRQLRERLHMDIAFDKFRNGYFNRTPNKQLPQFELSHGELFAITLGKEMLEGYSGTVFEPVLRSALQKIYERMPERVGIDIDDLRSVVRFNPGPIPAVSKKVFFDINRACEKSTPIEIHYEAASTGEVTIRTIEPQRMMDHRGVWYVIAFCRLRRALRLFAIHRIQSYALQSERFTPMNQKEIDAWMASPLFVEHREHEQQVVVRFKPRAARYIRERKWHHSQELTEHSDGSCTLKFTTASIDEVKRWLLTYGADVQVLKPGSLRDIIRDELSEAIKQYQ